MDVERGKVTCLSQTGCYANSVLFEGKTSDGSSSYREKRDFMMNEINIFIQIEEGKGCVGQSLENTKEEIR